MGSSEASQYICEVFNVCDNLTPSFDYCDNCEVKVTIYQLTCLRRRSKSHIFCLHYESSAYLRCNIHNYRFQRM